LRASEKALDQIVGRRPQPRNRGDLHLAAPK
jgi:hypothetical protein